jgi:hypothetical protein
MSLVHHLFNSVESANMGDKGTQALITALEKLSSIVVDG